MLRNYFKVALRNLQQQKALAVINILGLCIGLACFSLFLLYAVNEFSYDRFNTNAANIYRFVEWAEGFPNREPGGEAYGGTPAGPALKQDMPDVKAFARLQTGFDEKFVRVNGNITQSKLSFADADLFNMFSIKLLHGSRASALRTPGNIVLTKQKAIQLFGKTDVVGQRVDIKYDSIFEPFTVGAVTDDIPANSSLQFEMAGSFDYLMSTGMGRESANNWYMTIGMQTYVQLDEGSNLASQPERLAAFRKKYMPDEEGQFRKEGLWNGTGPLPITFRLQPLRDVHTNPRLGGINPNNIWLLIAIATGVLLIACINFTTLSIGRSAGRAKEVGVRKVMGGNRKQLVMQFLAESVLLSVASAVLALGLAQVLLPYFNEIADTRLSFSLQQFPELVWLLAGLALLTGLLAGAYPALVLSGFRPVEVLKSKIRLGGANLFTKSLVTLQFVLSVALIISTVIILQQLKYLRSKNIGFNKENVLALNIEGTDTKRMYSLLKQGLAGRPGIVSVSASEMGLGAGTGLMGMGFEYKGEMKGVITYPVDADFTGVLGMQLIAGRNFNAALTYDSVASVIVNEAFLKAYNVTADEALGMQLTQPKGFFKGPKTVIGVIRDFNFSPLKEAVRAQLFFVPASLDARNIFVRLQAGDPGASLAAIQKEWSRLAPGYPFRYNFLDESFNRFYKSEERWGSVMGSAGAISIFLACLGLFGLAALAAVNRTKEIGIRKVLGASTSAIVGLLSKDFLKLVTAAIVIATPLAWYFMNRWLLDYNYRIDIGWQVFAATGIVALLIALATVSVQAIRAAVANPVKSLRTE